MFAMEPKELLFFLGRLLLTAIVGVLVARWVFQRWGRSPDAEQTVENNPPESTGQTRENRRTKRPTAPEERKKSASAPKSFTLEQLAEYRVQDGTEGNQQRLTAVSGVVYDITSAQQLDAVAPGLSAFLSGYDGSYALATEKFKPKSLNRNLDELRFFHIQRLHKWTHFFQHTFKFPVVGYLRESFSTAAAVPEKKSEDAKAEQSSTLRQRMGGFPFMQPTIAPPASTPPAPSPETSKWLKDWDGRGCPFINGKMPPELLRDIKEGKMDLRTLHGLAGASPIFTADETQDSPADTQPPDQGEQLHAAVEEGDVSAITALLKEWSSLPVEVAQSAANQPCLRTGLTPVQKAVVEGHELAVRLLLQAEVGGAPMCYKHVRSPLYDDMTLPQLAEKFQLSKEIVELCDGE